MKDIVIINTNYIEEYKNIIQTTNLQRGYQELIKFFRYLRNYLQKEMTNFNFTANIVENNMDYSYFQFTNENLKKKGVKIVCVFLHKEFKYQVWLSGVNRQTQIKCFNMYEKNNKYTMSPNPDKTDYILSKDINIELNYDNIENLLNNFKKEIYMFIDDIN